MSNKCAVNCPVCTEEMDPTDLQLKPCNCGYEICVWCWNHIILMAEQNDTVGKCPACRAPYDKERILRNTISIERSAKQDSLKQKLQKTKSKQLELPKDLDSARVIRRNLVYVSGVRVILADEKTLRKREYFGQYGKIVKIVLVPAAEAFLNSRVVYITFSKVEEAIRCIEAVDGFILDGCPLKACFGTTRYCHTWLKNRRCSKPNCLYVHNVCPQEDICTKDDVASACSSKIQKSSGYAPNNLPPRSGSMLPPPMDNSCSRISNTEEKIFPQSLPHKHFKNSEVQPEKGDDRKYNALPSRASWASTPTSNQLSYVGVTASQGPVDHSHMPSNFICKVTDAGAQVPPPFKNISRSDDQISKSSYPKTMTSGLINDQQHFATGLREQTGLPNFWASDPNQVNAPCHNSLCAEQVLPKSSNQTKSNTVHTENSYGISTSTGNLHISDTIDVRSSTCAVGLNSLLYNRKKLPNKSFADERFNLQSLGCLSDSHHIPPLLENSIIKGNIGDSPEADNKEHDIKSDVLALDPSHEDHLIGSSLARHLADNDTSDYPIICDSQIAYNSYKSTNAFQWMENLDHTKTNFSKTNVSSMEYYGLLYDAKRSATHIYTCHRDNRSPDSQVKEHKSFNSQYSFFSSNDSNKPQSFSDSCPSALASKSKGSQSSASPSKIKSIPPGFHAEVAHDPDPVFLNASNPGSNFFSWEKNSVNSLDNHMLDNCITGNFFQSGQQICPSGAPSISVDLSSNIQKPSRLSNFAYDPVTCANHCASTIKKMYWQNGADIYDVPWGSASMGGHISSEPEISERSLPKILNRLVPGWKYAPPR